MSTIERLKKLGDAKYTFFDESQPPWLEMRFLYQNLDKLLAVVEAAEKCRAAVYDSQKLEAEDELIAAMDALDEETKNCS